MVNVPKCMSTQHPDNVEAPPYAIDGVLKGDGEVQEAAEVFSLGADEQMWDSEGENVALVHQGLTGTGAIAQSGDEGRLKDERKGTA